MSISMLDEKIPILIRETLHDQGQELHSNVSPDIIVRKTKFSEDELSKIFTETYNQDISLRRDDSEKMYLYVRFKNTSGKPLTDFYIHLYRNHLGLSNCPSDWEKYEMHTESGTCAHIEYLGAGKIGATPAFIYDKKTEGEHPNCFVAVATREKTPDYSSVSGWENYIKWVNKMNVAARNVCVISGSSGIYTQKVVTDNLHMGGPMLIRVRIDENTPSGVTYGIRQKELHIDEQMTYLKSDFRTWAINCEFIMSRESQYSFEVWFEANKDDVSKVVCRSAFYKKELYAFDSDLNSYLVDLRTGDSLSNGAENLPETSDCGYLLGCCYFIGSEAG